MALTIADLFASPDHYLQSFDGGDAIFVPMDRAAYHRSIFLDGRIQPAANGSMRVPVAMLAEHAAAPAATNWIFHVAHCGSTLLARALDRGAGNLVLREPLALRQAAVARDAARLALTAAMISKRYAPDLPTIVKANVPVNFLLDDLLAIQPRGRAIFLHCALDDYLLAILRSDDHRGWLRRVTAQLAPHLGDTARLSDGERAAALWLAQMQAFARAIGRAPEARSLDAEVFFAEPHATLAAAAQQLEVPMTAAEIDEIIAGPLFTTYSKNPDVAFDNQARLARRRETEAAIADDLTAARRWIDGRASDAAQATAAITAVAITA